MPCLKYFHLQLLAPALLVLVFPDHLNNPPFSFDGISLEVFIASSHSPFNLLSYEPYKIKFPISSPLPAVLLQLCVFVAPCFDLCPVWGDSSGTPSPTLVKQSLGVPWRVCKPPWSSGHVPAFPQVRKSLLGSPGGCQQGLCSLECI